MVDDNIADQTSRHTSAQATGCIAMALRRTSVDGLCVRALRQILPA
ncbi:MAG TPA: hypothetical protein VF635_11480 [Propionibacteriaceae bacterium]